MKPKIITVLSSPRSGSSALCGLLSHLGQSFGDNEQLKKPNSLNQYGYFEREDVLMVNELLLEQRNGEEPHRLLRSIGLNSQETRNVTNQWNWCTNQGPLEPSFDVAVSTRLELESIVEKFGVPEKVTACKDARFCLTLPVWEKYIEPLPIVLWRPYGQVKRSIEQMTKIPSRYAEWLWAHLTLSAFRVAQPHNYLVIKFDDLMYSTQETVEKIIGFLGQNGFLCKRNIQEAVRSIDRGVITQASNDDKLINKGLVEFVQWLEQGAVGSPPTLGPPPASTELLPLIEAVEFYYKERNYLSSENKKLEIKIIKQVGDLKIAHSQLERIWSIPGYSAVSWVLKRLGY